MNSQFTYELAEHRCFECGTFWFIEKTRELFDCRCPRCAGDEINKANARAAAAERSARAVKAAALRAKSKA